MLDTLGKLHELEKRIIALEGAKRPEQKLKLWEKLRDEYYRYSQGGSHQPDFHSLNQTALEHFLEVVDSVDPGYHNYYETNNALREYRDELKQRMKQSVEEP